MKQSDNFNSEDLNDNLMVPNPMGDLLDVNEEIKQSSTQTIFAITNSMIGSVCLTLPIVFKDCGIFSSLLVMVFLGLVQFKTCALILKHQTKDETDFQELIDRILGKGWSKFYKLSSGTYLFIVGIVYFLLVNKTCYSILIFLFTKIQFSNYAPISSSMTFNQFSIQYQALILVIPLSFLLLFKDISQIISLAKFGIIALCSYVLHVIFIFITSFSRKEFDASNIKFFTWEISKPAGQFCLAFLVHNTMGQMMNRNKKQENNIRDMGISYLFSGIIYAAIGIFGSIGINGLIANDPETILEFYSKGDITVMIIESLFLVHLFTAFPIFNFISRIQILSAFYPTPNPPRFVYYGFSAFYIIVCLLFQIANINPQNVIAFDGSVCGFVLVYVLPIYIHMKCYYSGSSEVGDVQTQSDKNKCNDHKDINSYARLTRIILYFGIIMVGFINLVLQLLDIFKIY